MRAIIGGIGVLAACCAAAPPISAQAAETHAEWARVASRRILCNLVYPFAPDAPRTGGLAVLDFPVDANGRIGPVSVVLSSGVPAFDAAALMAVKLSSPLPRPLAERTPVRTRLPIRFGPPPVSFGGAPAGKSRCGVQYGG